MSVAVRDFGMEAAPMPPHNAVSLVLNSLSVCPITCSVRKMVLNDVNSSELIIRNLKSYEFK